MMKKWKSKIKNKKLIFILFLLLITISVIQLTLMVNLENDVEVKPQTSLTYYLDVSYDGVDKFGVESNSTTVSQVKSGYIYVEDKIPEGLIFNGFVATEDGSIGAVKQSDGSTCLGKVVDDTDGTESLNSYHGLHYDEETRTVSFTVTNLQAGCVLTVGIQTITPNIDDPSTDEVETRRDFYNFATAKEDSLTKNSNTVHVWMGSESLKLYSVTYEYEGDIPENAPTLPNAMLYASGANVAVSSSVKLEGYEFSGWATSDATLVNGTFKMPDKNVVIKGSFTKIDPKTVTYEIEGTIPDGYIVPTTKEYYEGATVNLDSLKAGDVINGYRFLGWTTQDVEISEDNNFQMPDKNVTIIGKFEEVTYKVTYKFYDTVLPPNSDSLLPATKEYKPGETVTLESVTEPIGYKFLGWYKEDNFTMPEEDVVIYGEWKIQPGTFKPSITKEIIKERPYYKPGDLVQYKITVTNNENFAINNVIVKEENTNAYFIKGENYEVTSQHIVTIPTIGANQEVIIYAEYKVTSEDTGIITNKVSVLGASATNGYELDNQDVTAEDQFKTMSQVKICKNVSGVSVDKERVFQFNIAGEDNGYETWLALKDGECQTAYVEPGNYKVTEIVPQEYEIKSITGAITTNKEIVNVNEFTNYEITYTNEYKKKGFLRSFGRIVNIIRKEEDSDSE